MIKNEEKRRPSIDRSTDSLNEKSAQTLENMERLDGRSFCTEPLNNAEGHAIYYGVWSKTLNYEQRQYILRIKRQVEIELY